jgi:hypothetical protein
MPSNLLEAGKGVIDFRLLICWWEFYFKKETKCDRGWMLNFSVVKVQLLVVNVSWKAASKCAGTEAAMRKYRGRLMRSKDGKS